MMVLEVSIGLAFHCDQNRLFQVLLPSSLTIIALALRNNIRTFSLLLRYKSHLLLKGSLQSVRSKNSNWVLIVRITPFLLLTSTASSNMQILLLKRFMVIHQKKQLERLRASLNLVLYLKNSINNSGRLYFRAEQFQEKLQTRPKMAP